MGIEMGKELGIGNYVGIRDSMNQELDIHSVIDVSMYPGTMALTLIPLGPSSAARARVRPIPSPSALIITLHEAVEPT